jgi:hypothetical protein
MLAHRITNGKSTPFGLGSTKHQSGYSPFVVFCSATFFVARETLRVSYIGQQKTSFTLNR